MSGWIKLHRVFQDWEWYDRPNCVTVFIDLLLQANHEDGKYRGVSIPKGSLTTSHGKIAERTGLTISQVRNVLDKLSCTREIAVKSHTKFSMISITNWEKFQSDERSTLTTSQSNSSKIATNNNVIIKETKNNIIIKASPLAFLFKPEDDVQKWLLTGKPEVQKTLLDKYSHHVLAQEILKAFLWQSVKSKRKADLFLMNWLSNVKTNGFNPNQGEARFSRETNTNVNTTITEDDLNEARRMGII